MKFIATSFWPTYLRWDGLNFIGKLIRVTRVRWRVYFVFLMLTFSCIYFHRIIGIDFWQITTVSYFTQGEWVKVTLSNHTNSCSHAIFEVTVKSFIIKISWFGCSICNFWSLKNVPTFGIGIFDRAFLIRNCLPVPIYPSWWKIVSP